MNERGTGGWTDEPNASYRSYLYHAVEDEGAHYAAVIRGGVDTGPEVSDIPPHWTFEVRKPNGVLLCAGLIKSAGEPGRELARAMCDASLGHEPRHGYRVSRREANGDWTHTVVLPRSGVEAKRQARQSGDLQRAMRGDYREERLQPRELRAYYRGDFGPKARP